MANLILPDSNIYLRALRNGGNPFQDFAVVLDDRDWEFATCGMVTLEVCRGLRDPTLLARYRERFAVMLYIHATAQIWERASQLAWTLDRKGQVLPAPDLLIAACALQANATLLTADVHFKSIPGLRVIDHLI